MPTSYHCELAWLGGDRAERDVLVRVDGERITAVEPGATGPAADATRLAGLTVPGFANAHSHAFHRALRGRTQRGAGSFWTWREQMYAVAATLDPDRYHRLAPGDVRRDGARGRGDGRRVPLPPPRARAASPTTIPTRWAPR